MTDERENKPAPEPDDAIGRLVEDARVELVPVPPADAADGSADVARENITCWLKRYNVPMADLARMVGVAPSTLSEVLAGRYKAKPTMILKRCLAATNEWFRRKSAPAGEQFVMTRIAREIFAVVRAASKYRGIGVVTGPSGIGKSKTLEAVVQLDFPSAVLVEVNPGSANRLDFLRAILRAERTRNAKPAQTTRGRGWNEGVYHTSAAFNMAVDRLADSGRLIIVDEADNLKNETLAVIRQLHDATGCPVVLVGRPPLHDKIKRTIQSPDIGGSFVGRVCVEHRLEPKATGGGGDRWLFTVGEIRAMLDQFKVTYTPEAARWLCSLANIAAMDTYSEAGAVRYAIKVWQMALTMYSGQQITVSMLRQANTLLRGEEWSQMADRLAAQMVREAKAVG